MDALIPKKICFPKVPWWGVVPTMLILTEPYMICEVFQQMSQWAKILLRIRSSQNLSPIRSIDLSLGIWDLTDLLVVTLSGSTSTAERSGTTGKVRPYLLRNLYFRNSWVSGVGGHRYDINCRNHWIKHQPTLGKDVQSRWPAVAVLLDPCAVDTPKMLAI